MILVDYDTLVREPVGTIFAPYDPCYYADEFHIKTDQGWPYKNWKNEPAWGFNGAVVCKPGLEDNCIHIATKPGEHIDASWDEHDYDNNDASEYKLFVILEKKDILEWIKTLTWAMDGCPGNLSDYLEGQHG